MPDGLKPHIVFLLYVAKVLSQQKLGGDPWQTREWCHPGVKVIEQGLVRFIQGSLTETVEQWQ